MPKIMIKVLKRPTYHLPAGRFAGRCAEVVETTKLTTAGPIPQVRFRFNLNVAAINHSTPMAAVSFDMDSTNWLAESLIWPPSTTGLWKSCWNISTTTHMNTPS
ncbi:MAG: hypothetical protein EBU46_14040 [Nitrosomonadaceae bacterium]|nr:hypothetical protein [Nitrosomonadaceae bacterium]